MELLGDVGHVESHSVRLEMVLVLVQAGCTVCAERTMGSEIVLDAPLKWKLVSVRLEIVLFLTQERCAVCVEGTVGSVIVLDAPDGTPR